MNLKTGEKFQKSSMIVMQHSSSGAQRNQPALETGGILDCPGLGGSWFTHLKNAIELSKIFKLIKETPALRLDKCYLRQHQNVADTALKF